LHVVAVVVRQELFCGVLILRHLSLTTRRGGVSRRVPFFIHIHHTGFPGGSSK